MLDPTTASRLAITPPPQQIEFTRLPSKALLHALNTHLGSHPNTIVRFFFDRGDWTSLKFLREIPNVRQLLLQNTNMRKPITDLAPLAYVDELRLLSISHIAPKQMDFTPLLRFAKCLRDIRIWIDKKAHGSS